MKDILTAIAPILNDSAFIKSVYQVMYTDDIPGAKVVHPNTVTGSYQPIEPMHLVENSIGAAAWQNGKVLRV